MKSKLTVILYLLCIISMGATAQTRKRQTTTKRPVSTQKSNPAMSGYAAQWIGKAQAGDAEAQALMSDCYLRGWGVLADFGKSMEWAKKASANGNPYATWRVGNLYENGSGVEANETTAHQWYDKAKGQASTLAEKNDGAALYILGVLSEEQSEKIKYWIASAEQGYVWSQYELGYAYDNGQGVDQDYTEAVKWYRKAAEQGNPWAQNSVGYAYDKGQGVDQDYVEAAKWYRKAAEEGYVIAQKNLAYFYRKGQGVTQSPSEAIKWYTKAAQQGNASAAIGLSFLYDGEDGVQKNAAKSTLWCFIAYKYEDDEETWKKYLNWATLEPMGKLIFCTKEFNFTSGLREDLGLVGKWKGNISAEGKQMDLYLDLRSNGTYTKTYVLIQDEAPVTIHYKGSCTGTYVKDNNGGIRFSANNSSWKLVTDLDFKSGVPEENKALTRNYVKNMPIDQKNQILVPMKLFDALINMIDDEVAFNQEALVFTATIQGKTRGLQFGRVNNIP